MCISLGENSNIGYMISVIVAMYNAEPYIRKCMDSLLAQRYVDFEVVCVDDASQDGSVGIVEEYAKRDARIRLLRMERNVGQAVARNYAIEHARGDIVTTLDADDWFDEESLEGIAEVFDRYPKTDCALFRCVDVYEDGRTEEYNGKEFDVLGGEEACFLSLTWSIHGSYATRRELYERYPYDTTCHLYSDDNTTHIHYYVSREVRQSNARYYYLQHSRSATHRVSTERMSYMEAADSLCRQLVALSCSEEMSAEAETQRWRIVVDSYYYYYTHRKEFSKQERRYCLDEIKKGWKRVERKRLKGNISRKFGYVPFRGSWTLFRAEEELYFALRGILGRN